MAKTERVQRIGLRMFGHAGTIFLLAVIIGVMVNQIRSDRLPLVADWSPKARLTLESGESMVIQIEEARELFLSQSATFLDARSSKLYEYGHILRARNLPWNAVDEHFDTVMADIHQDALLIAYCDGESCAESKYLALELFYRGYENVRVLVNGWSLWIEQHLPVAKGPWQGES
jgi:3-mercaptopyruvate sulfurtransferase SseA